MIRKVSSIYSILMGVSMFGMWMVFYLTGSIPEIDTKPIELGMHVLAETLTAVLLIVGGIGLMQNRKWGLAVYLISTGMLLYTLVMSPGYFLQKGETGFVFMFASFIVLAVVFLVLVLKSTGFAHEGGTSTPQDLQ